MAQATLLNKSNFGYGSLAEEPAGVGEAQGKAFGLPVSAQGSDLPATDQERLRIDYRDFIPPDTKRKATKLPDEKTTMAFGEKETIDALSKEVTELKFKIMVESGEQCAKNKKEISAEAFDYDKQVKIITEKQKAVREKFIDSREHKGMTPGSQIIQTHKILNFPLDTNILPVE